MQRRNLPLARTTLVSIALALTLPALAEGAQPSVLKAIEEAKREVAKIIAVPAKQRTFNNTCLALDDLSARLDNTTSLSLFQQFVSTDAAERAAARASEEALSNFSIDLSQREDLYKAIMEYASTKPSLAGEKKRFLDYTLRDYRRAGMMLPKAQRTRLATIQKELEKLGVDFEQNIAEDATKLPLGKDELKGVSDDALSRVPRVGDIYLLGFDGPTYGAVMDNCEIEATRQKMQWLYRRRGGERNVQLLEKMLLLRAEMSTILGFKNLVDYVTEPRMAKNSETVKKFYNELTPLVKAVALQNQTEFAAAKKEATKNPDAEFKPWDYSFLKEYLLKTKFAVDSEKVAEYFPMDAVVKGLFDITQTLYNVTMTDVTSNAGQFGVKLWHPEVKLYEFKDNETGKKLGYLATDLHPRPNKYSHAACWGLRGRKTFMDGTSSLPLAALVCNFTKPTAAKPSLLRHDEVETFFHEFGHGLHNIFSQTELSRFGGTGVARDFVEAPSQMMENWVWSSEVLKRFAKHYKTGEVIPDALLKGMQSARTLGSGIETAGQIFLGQMDQQFHLVPGGKVDTTGMLKQVYESTTIYKYTPETYYQASFGHLVGYEGAYYGYLWSLVYAQDMFQRFEELGVLNPATGKAYRDKVLAKGGTRDEMDLLQDFLGRMPKYDAFYRHLGLQSK